MSYSIEHTVQDGIERIAYRPHGRKFETPILMQHGMWHGAWSWQPWQELFAEWGWESHAFSLPGHGKSARRRSYRWCTLQYYYQFLAAEIKRMSRPPVLMGHSMGGALTQWHLKRSDDLPAAVLVASWPSRSTMLSLFRVCRRYPLSALRSFLTFSAQQVTATPRRVGELFITANALLSPPELHARLCPDSLLIVLQYQPPFWKPPLHTRTPILWLGGSKDVITYEPVHRASAVDYGADYLMVEKAGHDLMLEKNSRQTAESVHTWLAGKKIV
jgi:pimeloyl-ACP methyl ester carboxylesterase